MNKERKVEFWTWVVKIVVISAALLVPTVLFLALEGRSWFTNNWDKVIGVSFGIMGLATYILAELTSSKTAKDLEKIRELADSIADYTRKPLIGVVEILHECDKLLEDSVKAGGNMWFVGFTLGIGPAHAIPANIDEWRSKYPAERSFDAMTGNIHDNLGAILGGARSCCIVILSESLVDGKFITPLYAVTNTNQAYRAFCSQHLNHLDEVKTMINKLAISIKRRSGAHPIVEVTNVPLQLIVADVRKDGILKRACVVFHVGTENIGSGAVQGFYSELPNICEMFRNFCESLAASK
jgi:hypothetical protein